MIDALYPIMGGMISKYVTQAIKEMMETINTKIENGLSFDSYKRKIKSKITGVSETELLLEESSDAIISSLFVIQKESGLLIAQSHLENKEIDDPHMVASMASAIKDFVNDWVQSQEEQSEVQILSYGNATLYIESAGSVYIIAFLNAEPNHEQRSQINEFFASVVKKYADFFQTFNGDDSAEEIENLSSKMLTYLNMQEIPNKDKKIQSKNPAKYFLFFLGLILIGYIVYLFNGWYFHYQLETQINEQTGQKVNISGINNQLILEGHLDSAEKFHKIEEIIKKETKSPIINNLVISMKQIDNMLQVHRITNIELNEKVILLKKDFEKSVSDLNKKIQYMEITLQDAENQLFTKIKQKRDEIQVLKKEKTDIKKAIEIKKEIVSKLDKVFSDNRFYNKKDNSLDFSKLNLFVSGATTYDTEAMKILSEDFKKYIMILGENKGYINAILIEGHTDSTGNEEENIMISQHRALTVADTLLNLDIVKKLNIYELIYTVGLGSEETIKINGIEDKNASRRIKIKFELHDKMILEKIKKIIHD